MGILQIANLFVFDYAKVATNEIALSSTPLLIHIYTRLANESKKMCHGSGHKSIKNTGKQNVFRFAEN